MRQMSVAGLSTAEAVALLNSKELSDAVKAATGIEHTKRTGDSMLLEPTIIHMRCYLLNSSSMLLYSF